jgi:phage repressor protein C with HTH and peptisase S24 domain
MEPRLFAGEVVFVRFGQPPVRGGDAVVELKDDAVIIKTFTKTAEGWLFLKQWNPESEIRLRWDQVRALHAVRARA